MPCDGRWLVEWIWLTAVYVRHARPFISFSHYINWRKRIQNNYKLSIEYKNLSESIFSIKITTTANIAKEKCQTCHFLFKNVSIVLNILINLLSEHRSAILPEFKRFWSFFLLFTVFVDLLYNMMMDKGNRITWCLPSYSFLSIPFIHRYARLLARGRAHTNHENAFYIVFFSLE